jgi:hypothetical protein
MFNSLYGYGQTPYQQDLMNWNTRNTNKDIYYNNQLAGASGGGWQRALSGAVRGAGTGFLSTGNPFGALAGGLAGGIGGFM